GTILLATEPRIKAGVLISGGIQLFYDTLHPMTDIVNYAPRITTPVLMLNGRYDHSFPYESSQRRLFELLGTPAADKAHVVYESGHINYPENGLPRDVGRWFDKYLGAVPRCAAAVER